jgi:hypothetical protein
VPSDKQPTWWAHNPYRTLRDANIKAANAELISNHINRGFNVIRPILYIMSNLPKPNLLYTIVRVRTPAFGLIGIRMVIMLYGCKRGLE